MWTVVIRDEKVKKRKGQTRSFLGLDHFKVYFQVNGTALLVTRASSL